MLSLAPEIDLMRAFYRERGLDIDQPMVRAVRFRTLEEKNIEHEEWHRAFERSYAST